MRTHTRTKHTHTQTKNTFSLANSRVLACPAINGPHTGEWVPEGGLFFFAIYITAHMREGARRCDFWPPDRYVSMYHRSTLLYIIAARTQQSVPEGAFFFLNIYEYIYTHTLTHTHTHVAHKHIHIL